LTRRAGFLILCAVALGAGCGLLFVYASDLPEIRALETYRPDVVTEVYADDGQLAGSFALQRRILMTYEQCPKILYNAVTAIEDQHFEEHWGIDFPRMASAAFHNLVKRRITGGASTITMQLAGNLFLTAATAASAAKCRKFCWRCRSSGATPSRKFHDVRKSSVPSTRELRFRGCRAIYFGKPVTDLKLQEAALLAGMVKARNFHRSRIRNSRSTAAIWCFIAWKKKGRSHPRKKPAPGNRRSLCTFSIRATTSRLTSSKKFASILNPRTAPKPCTSAGCASTPR